MTTLFFFYFTVDLDVTISQPHWGAAAAAEAVGVNFQSIVSCCCC